MAPFDVVDDQVKEKLLRLWQGMPESDKTHFINQVALALSIWGSDERGKRLVVEVLKVMVSDGAQTLADFGLYVDQVAHVAEPAALADKVRRAAVIIDGYRLKNALSSEPHRELDV